jgi:hypothetical protein
MKLSTIARSVLKEDTNLNPANQPATAMPPQESAEKVYDVLHDYQGFETMMDKQVESIKQGFISTLSKNLLNKQVTFRASKGAIGQINKDYTIVVTGIDVSQLKEEYYIILKDKDKKDYYVDTTFKMKVGEPKPDDIKSKETNSPQASEIKPPAEGEGFKKPVSGNIAYPQSVGMQSNRP